MKRIKKKLTAMLNAMTFAEAGEHETAIKCLDEGACASEDETFEYDAAKLTRREEFVGLAEDHLIAATGVKEGEFDTALEMLDTRKLSKAVLLISDGRPVESDAFIYAINLCRRVEAGLEVVALADETKGDEVARVLAAYEPMKTRCSERYGVTCTVSALSVSSIKELFDYVRKHKEIAAVIYGSHDPQRNRGRGFGLLRTLEAIVERLSIPLVNVLTRQSAVHVDYEQENFT
jgi:hypothetical protein